MSPAQAVNTPSSPTPSTQMPAMSPAPAEMHGPATVQAALARLEHSRERLRQVFKPPPAPAPGSESGFRHPVRRARAWLRKTPWGGLLDPALDAAGEELNRWWQGQAWRHPAGLLKDTFSSELVPLVRRHPLAAVLLTALAGAALARSGLWRWRPVRRSAGQIGSRVRRAFMNQIANPAIQSVLLAALVSYLTPKRPAENSQGTAAHADEKAPAAAN